MIRRREATATVYYCDACTKTTRVYSNGPEEDWHFDCPEGWVYFPDSLLGEPEPRIVLCPEHAHLTATARLVEKMMNAVAATVVRGDA